MLHIFYGRDTFSLRQALAEIKAQLEPQEMLDYNVAALDGRQVTPDQLMAVCETVPFLASHRLAIVEGLLQRFQTGRGRAPSRRGRKSEGASDLDRWSPFAGYVGQMPSSTILVLVDEEVSAGNPLLELLKPGAEIRHFQPPYRRALPDWIRRRAADNGLKLTPRAIQLLADLVGNDLWILASEIDKLAAYANGRSLDEPDLRSLVSAAREVNVFAVVDAIVGGRAALATKLLRQVVAQGADSSYVFAMILRQYRNLVLAREQLDAGVRSSEIASRLNIRSEFAMERLLQQAERCDWPRLTAAYRRLLAADAAIKRGIYSEELSLTLLVQDLTARR